MKTCSRYNEMVAFQNNLCAICGQPPIKTKYGKLDVDHDHGTNQLRELLCNPCNRALGAVNDSEEILLKMVEYLRKHRKLKAA